MNMKRVLLVLAISAFGAIVTTALLAVCGTSTVVNNTNGWQPAVGGGAGLGTTVLCGFWQVGNGASANSGTLAQSNMATSYSTGYYVSTNWANANVAGCPGTYPPTGTRTAFLYSISNSNKGQYLIMSTAWSTSAARYNFDDISNGPGNTPSPILIPSAASRSIAAVTGGYDYTLNWTAMSASALKGFYDSAPANNIITGLAVYYSTSGTQPSNAIGGWTLAAGGPNSRTGYLSWGTAGSDPGTITVFVPTGTTFVAFSLLFDGAVPGDGIRETRFLGTPAVGPTASPLFANVTADPTTVAWTSGDESRVASYQAYWSPTANGTYRPLGQPVAAKGAGQSYSVSYRVFAPVYYVKIKASKTDGTVDWSSAVKVTRIAPEPKPFPGKPLPGKPGLRK